MAKTGRAHTQFTPGAPYLASLIVARWTSLPTIVSNKFSLAIQLKLNINVTIPLDEHQLSVAERRCCLCQLEWM